jgi:hypothetical protein
LIGLREDDAVVSYIGPCGPAVAVSLASTRSSEPTTELTSPRSDTTNGDATAAPEDEEPVDTLAACGSCQALT